MGYNTFYINILIHYYYEKEFLDYDADYWAEVMNDIRWMSEHC